MNENEETGKHKMKKVEENKIRGKMFFPDRKSVV